MFETVNRQRVYEQVAQQIRQAILTGEIRPGTPIPTERELVATFGVSRASVREALRALQAQGLLVGGGANSASRFVVSDNTDEFLRDAVSHSLQIQRVALQDLVELRIVLEAAAVKRAAARQDQRVLEDARRALRDQTRPDLTIAAFENADLSFHLALVRASGNEAMHVVMLGLRDATARYLADRLQRQPNPEDAFARLAKEHAAILAAVESGDGATAAQLLTEHIGTFYDEGA